jgi:hypothetical protein
MCLSNENHAEKTRRKTIVKEIPHTNSWKLNNSLLNEQWVTDEIKGN